MYFAALARLIGIPVNTTVPIFLLLLSPRPGTHQQALIGRNDLFLYILPQSVFSTGVE
jgi:hypothetical protein